MKISVKQHGYSKFFSTYYEDNNVKIETEDEENIEDLINVADSIARYTDNEDKMCDLVVSFIKHNYDDDKIKELFGLSNEFNNLQHHRDTSIGLWATDRPDLIPEDIKHLFFEIN